MFTNREIAIAIWGTVAALVAVVKVPKIRPMLRDIVRQLLHPKLFLPIVLLAGYVALLVAGLNAVGLWSSALLKDTLLWFFFLALPLTFSLATSKTQEGLFTGVLSRTVSLFIVLEFLIEYYTFSLPVELVLVPVITLVVLMVTLAASDKKFEIPHKFLTAIQSLIGLGIIWFAIDAAYDDRSNLWSFGMLLNFLLVPVLSVLLIPFIHALALYSGYQEIFIWLDFGAKKQPKEPGLIRYAKYRLMGHFKLSRGKLLRFLKDHPPDHFMRIQSRADVDCLLQEEATPHVHTPSTET